MSEGRPQKEELSDEGDGNSVLNTKLEVPTWN